MLDPTFKYPAVLRRMRVGPLAIAIDEIAGELSRLGYTLLTRRRYLSLLARFSRYAAARGFKTVSAVEPGLAETFLQRVRMPSSTRSLARSALGHALRHLGQLDRRQFIRAGAMRECQLRRDDRTTLQEFEAHLYEVRGLQPKSVEGILLHSRRMLVWYRSHHPRRQLRHLRGEDVLAFVAHVAEACVADRSRVAVVSHVRGLLRYLHGKGVLRRDLARLVPRIPSWRDAHIPPYLAWEDVRTTIDSIDRSTPVGKRDQALFLVFATTGLRSQEVRRLELGDVDWRAGELRIRRTKVRRERVVPLVAEAEVALVDYVLHGRPAHASRTLFLRHVAPVGPLLHSGAISAIVRRRLKLSGHVPARAGAHLLRHSLATRLVQQGRPIKEIADVLGHRHIDTTAIYIKVALPQLGSVALPFPGAEE